MALPGTNAARAGYRYGTIIRVGERWIHVRMDGSKRVRLFPPNALAAIEDEGERQVKCWYHAEIIFKAPAGTAIKGMEVLSTSVEGAETRARELFTSRHQYEIVSVKASYLDDVHPQQSIYGRHRSEQEFREEIASILKWAGADAEKYDIPAAARWLEEDQYTNAPNGFMSVLRRHMKD